MLAHTITRTLSSLAAGRFAAALFFLFAAPLALAIDERTGGPYVPTPQGVVDAMLELAQVGPRDFVVDLGSGDGRIVLTAARRYSARGFGVDIDKELVDKSNAEARRLGLADRVTFQQQDVMEARVEDATVLTLYLLPGMMQLLQPKLARELRPGTRIVSHDFPMGEWKPDRELSVDVPEKYGSPGDWKSTLYYWIVPAQIAGSWQLTAPALLSEPLALTLQQRYQFVEGGTQARGKRVPVANGRLEADRVRFTLALPGGSFEFRGVVDGDRMRGEVVHAGRSAVWSATKTGAAASAAH